MEQASSSSENYELQPQLSAVLEDYETGMDKKFGVSFAEQGFQGQELAFCSRLWSVEPICLATHKLTNMFQSSGLVAKSLFNPMAYSERIITRFGIDSTIQRTHLICSVELDDTTFYVDPQWQQFILQQAGITVEEIFESMDFTVMPHDRHLVYTAQQLGDVAEYYASIVTMLQEKVARGVLRGRADSYTREIRVAQLFNSDSILPPVDQKSFEFFYKTAYDIWNPSHYRIVDNNDVTTLQQGKNGSRLP